MAEHRDVGAHLISLPQLLLHVDDLRDYRHVHPRDALDDVTASVANGSGQAAATLQVLDEVEAQKVGVDIDTHRSPSLLLDGPAGWRSCRRKVYDGSAALGRRLEARPTAHRCR
ncbi:MAG: hypothetical protein ACRDQI_11300 [Pseudonocardiaceae bacterium]